MLQFGAASRALNSETMRMAVANLNGIRRPAFATAAAPPRPLFLALDLDETLVRVGFRGNRARMLDRVDYSCQCVIGGKRYDLEVSKRPGVDRFLRWAEQHRRSGLIEGPWIFTTAAPEYTEAVLDGLDPTRSVIQGVLSRDACDAAPTPGLFLKDLKKLPVPDTRRALLVDNSPVSHFLYPDNAVLVSDWRSDDPEDVELERVQHLLENILLNARAQYNDDYASHLSTIRGYSEFRKALQGFGKHFVEEQVRLKDLKENLRAIIDKNPLQFQVA